MIAGPGAICHAEKWQFRKIADMMKAIRQFCLRRRGELNESLSTPVIASVAKQSSAAATKAGLLRYARNDALNFACFLGGR
jgi:hypothetical protein